MKPSNLHLSLNSQHVCVCAREKVCLCVYVCSGWWVRAAWGSLLISVGINRKIESKEYKSIIVCLWGVCGVERLLRAKKKQKKKKTADSRWMSCRIQRIKYLELSSKLWLANWNPIRCICRWLDSRKLCIWTKYQIHIYIAFCPTLLAKGLCKVLKAWFDYMATAVYAASRSPFKFHIIFRFVEMCWSWSCLLVYVSWLRLCWLLC